MVLLNLYTSYRLAVGGLKIVQIFDKVGEKHFRNMYGTTVPTAKLKTITLNAKPAARKKLNFSDKQK